MNVQQSWKDTAAVITALIAMAILAGLLISMFIWSVFQIDYMVKSFKTLANPDNVQNATYQIVLWLALYIWFRDFLRWIHA